MMKINNLKKMFKWNKHINLKNQLMSYRKKTINYTRYSKKRKKNIFIKNFKF